MSERDPRFGKYSIVGQGEVEAGKMSFDEAKRRTIAHMEYLLQGSVTPQKRQELLSEIAAIRNI